MNTFNYAGKFHGYAWAFHSRPLPPPLPTRCTSAAASLLVGGSAVCGCSGDEALAEPKMAAAASSPRTSQRERSSDVKAGVGFALRSFQVWTAELLVLVLRVRVRVLVLVPLILLLLLLRRRRRLLLLLLYYHYYYNDDYDYYCCCYYYYYYYYYYCDC